MITFDMIGFFFQNISNKYDLQLPIAIYEKFASSRNHMKCWRTYFIYKPGYEITQALLKVLLINNQNQITEK